MWTGNAMDFWGAGPVWSAQQRLGAYRESTLLKDLGDHPVGQRLTLIKGC